MRKAFSFLPPAARISALARRSPVVSGKHAWAISITQRSFPRLVNPPKANLSTLAKRSCPVTFPTDDGLNSITSRITRIWAGASIPVRNASTSGPLDGRVAMKGVILETQIRTANPDNKNCVRVRLANGKEVVAFVPGVRHDLRVRDTVLVGRGRLEDVPGVKFKCIRGKYDLPLTSPSSHVAEEGGSRSSGATTDATNYTPPPPPPSSINIGNRRFSQDFVQGFVWGFVFFFICKFLGIFAYILFVIVVVLMSSF